MSHKWRDGDKIPAGHSASPAGDLATDIVLAVLAAGQCADCSGEEHLARIRAGLEKTVDANTADATGSLVLMMATLALEAFEQLATAEGLPVVDVVRAAGAMLAAEFGS